MGAQTAVTPQKTPSDRTGKSGAGAMGEAESGCSACHADIVKQYRENSAAHARNGVTCTSCHVAGAAHAQGGATARQAPESAAETNAECASCHAGAAANFTYPHPVIEAEGCVSCHTAHGSPNAAMLTKSDTNAICAQCHLPAHAKGGPTAASGDHAPAAACTSCHTQIHGSNTSEVFIR